MATYSNIILLTIDTLRSDRVGFLSHNDPSLTSNLDRLAHRGVIFTHCFAQSSWSRPSFASLLTSLYPSQHGAQRNFPRRGEPAVIDNALDPAVTTWPEFLQRHGYHTACFQGNAELAPSRGLARGFDFYCWDEMGKAYPLYRLFNRLIGRWISGIRTDDAIPSAPQVFSYASSWLEGNNYRPFFLWINFMDLHQPYYEPPGLWDWRHSKSIDPAILAPAKYPRLLSLDERCQVISLYEDKIAFLDGYIGMLMEILEEQGLLDDSILVFMSDHGEEFWDHGDQFDDPYFYHRGVSHGHTLYNEQMHVPLLVICPNLTGPRLVNDPVRVVDVFPTVVDLAGLSAVDLPHTEGGSLVTLMQGGRRSWALQALFAESLDQGPEKKAVIKGRYKLIYHTDSRECELYDLVADPKEQMNLADQSHQPVLADLREELFAWMERMPSNAGIPLQEKDDIRVVERLRCLGYIE